MILFITSSTIQTVKTGTMIKLLSQGIEGVQISPFTLIGTQGAFLVHLGHSGIASYLAPSNDLVMVICTNEE